MIYFRLPITGQTGSCQGDAWLTPGTCQMTLVADPVYLFNHSVNVCEYGWCYLALSDVSKNLSTIENEFSYAIAVTTLNGSSQRYTSYRDGININGDYDVARKYGYAVFFSTPEIITTTKPILPTITLYSGWNLVGNLEYGSTRTLGDIKTNIGPTVTFAYYFNDGTWYSADATVVPTGKSVMIYVTSDTQWSE